MSPAFWAVVPAGGVGRRMAAEIPKQYLRLGGQTVLELSLGVLYGVERIAGVVVAIGADDVHWPNLAPRLVERFRRPLLVAPGGGERATSVANALATLAGVATEDDWVLVHDAARPCLRAGDVARLIDTLADDPVGGLLGFPVRDTMKRADADDRVAATVDRSALWHSLTPQMFRLGALRAALAAAERAGHTVTDDASAMELAGQRPRLVEGHADNIKITRPEDLAVAEFFLRQQGRL